MRVICVDSPYIDEAAKQRADAVIQGFNDIVVTRDPSAGIRIHPSHPPANHQTPLLERFRPRGSDSRTSFKVV